MDLLIYSSLTMVNASKAIILRWKNKKSSSMLCVFLLYCFIVSCVFSVHFSSFKSFVTKFKVCYATASAFCLDLWPITCTYLLFVHPFKSTLLTIHLNTPPPIFLVIAIMESSIHITFISKKLNLIVSMLVLGVWQVVAITTLWID
jgi:hypothetical protein